jgi:NAD(P)-dependent dehydrogenase (short-subunit alcohol dehydrogenase family)
MTDRQMHLAEIRAKNDSVSPEEALKRIGAAQPMKRLADPEEIASVIAFLCSEPAAYVSGQSITVDGALTGCLG